MKVARMTRAMERQNQLFSEAVFSEYETDEIGKLIKAKERQNLMSLNLFNVTQEQVENPLYWINL
ncbi:hypothetical protein IQ264_24145 [Phormidium sp. LEGE 05292]|uniref:hypothetical protein n=1 Tax=[Phormidium] sp. LEGE 05292 TaxID=767427 RepID=UPI00187FAF9E|nr:hypothetical protein [Phormidium sp. LEGE 05292]MBE9228511.1 hypothetical protein [Phormidium sp. LEGE 05292]